MHGRAQAVMKEARLDACICTSRELIYYFTGHAAHTQYAIGLQEMILPEGDATPCLVLRYGDVS